ncbi:hypothetical protein QYM36_018002 [Artemia franciscana]|uniref:Uncharacterized protein n=1 Tax=Artemia franciscana TaxID=6661 RepID=A0AA88L0Y5_ARTSF|nr:hypothetical protein QYM36_018002 [Artemia franciscana]
MGCQWKCPMCKGNTQGSNVNTSEIARVVDASIKNSLSGFENAVKTLDVKIKEAVKDSFASFKHEIKVEIDTQFKAIEDRIHTLEQSSGMAKDNNTLKDLVTTEVATLKKTLDEQFENRVKAMIAEDRERQKRKLNIVKLNRTLVLDQMPEAMNSYWIPFLLNHMILDQAKLITTILLLKD